MQFRSQQIQKVPNADVIQQGSTVSITLNARAVKRALIETIPVLLMIFTMSFIHRFPTVICFTTNYFTTRNVFILVYERQSTFCKVFLKIETLRHHECDSSILLLRKNQETFPTINDPRLQSLINPSPGHNLQPTEPITRPPTTEHHNTCTYIKRRTLISALSTCQVK